MRFLCAALPRAFTLLEPPDGSVIHPDGMQAGLFRPVQCVRAADHGRHDAPTGIWLVYPSRSHVPTKVRAFVDFMRKAIDAPEGRPRQG